MQSVPRLERIPRQGINYGAREHGRLSRTKASGARRRERHSLPDKGLGSSYKEEAIEGVSGFRHLPTWKATLDRTAF